MVLILVLVTIATFLVLDYHWLHRSSDASLRLVSRDAMEVSLAALAPLPGDIFLAPGHTWLQLQPSGNVRVGAGELALRALGGANQFEVLPPGARIATGSRLAALHGGGRSIDLHSPIDGTIVAINPRLGSTPVPSELRYEDGWLYSVRPHDLAAALRRATVGQQARAWLRSETARLRDFFVGLSARRDQLAPSLLDGGIPSQGFGTQLGDDDWGAFVEAFFHAGGEARDSDE